MDPSDMLIDATVGKAPTKFIPPGFGWHRDVQDFRDYTPFSPQVIDLFNRLPTSGTTEEPLPEKVDMREFFPGVYDQRHINSCTAFVCAGMLEYFEKRTTGRTIEPSCMFLYQVIRKLMRAKDNSGAAVRTGLKAMIRFGLPPDQYWPYETARVDHEPEAFLYSFAGNCSSLTYLRLDVRNANGSQTLNMLRAFLAAGFPIAFGFPVPSSISQDADIPYRPTMDSVRGGQAVIAVGYDDRRVGSTRGALLVRNSWGKQWGDDGYGWLPYRYVEEQLAGDFWTLLSPEWTNSGEFVRPRVYD